MNEEIIKIHKSIIENELKHYNKETQYLEFRCSNENCDVLNYEKSFTIYTVSLRLRPIGGCYKCKSKILVRILDEKINNL